MVRGAKKTRAEIEAGKQYGNMTIIGDTGKRSKNGDVILLAKDEKNNYREILSGNLFHKPEMYTGWSKERRESVKSNAITASKIATQKFSFDGSRANVLRDGKTNNALTGYVGITFEKQNNNWKARLKFKGKTYSRFFDKFTDAVVFRNQKAMEMFNPILKKAGLPTIQKIALKNIVKNDYVIAKEKIITAKTDRKHNVNGVYVFFDKSRNRYRVYTEKNKKRKYLGTFIDEQEAIAAKQKYINKLQEEINNDI
ncbi:TPA: hypothetical protein ACH6J6_000307 [Enterococcus faecium]